MKKLVLGVAALFIYEGASAQLARKYVLFEHFTQASCGPCASQNPGFKNNILTKNEGNIHHISYHTSWPGVDPMNSLNPAPVQNRVNYYGITGVPTMKMLGNKFSGSPAGVTQPMIDTENNLGSPLKVNVSTSPSSGGSTSVNVGLESINNIPAGTYVLHVAVVEKTVIYSNPPGSNGERVFPNVFRKFLTATGGDSYTPAAKGSSVMNTYTFSMDPAWNPDSIYAIAFVQEVGSKTVVNSGSNLDAPAPVTYGDIVSQSAPFLAGTTSSASTFSTAVTNFGSTADTYRVKFSTVSAPSDWSVTYTVGGTSYTDSCDVAVPAGASSSMAINVQPGNTPAVGEYQVTLVSLTNARTLTITKKFRVISGVTDLVVSATGDRGDNVAGSAKDWENVYLNGLQGGGCTTLASTSSDALNDGITFNALTGVKNLYYNIGWTFPALSDTTVAKLQKFLDNGGNLLMAGQDVAWSVSDATSGFTSLPAKTFINQYMKAVYKADGTSSNNKFIAEGADAVFGGISTSTIFNYYNFASGFYPDELTIQPSSGAAPVFYYTADKKKIGGIRYRDIAKGYKTVYLGIGLEMLSDASVRNAIVDQSYKWFNNQIVTSVSNAETERAFEVFPNPAAGSMNVYISGATSSTSVKLVDLQGKTVLLQTASADSESIRMDISAIEAGIYFCQIVEGNSVTGVKKVIVTK